MKFSKTKESLFTRKLLSFFLLLCSLGFAQKTQGDILQKYHSIKGPWPDSIDVQVGNLPEKALLVDVRAAEEIHVSILPGAYTEDELMTLMDRGLISKETPIYVYCTIGYRSGKFAHKWRKKGWNTFNIVGGVLSWAQKGKEFLIPKSDSATTKVHVYDEEWNYLPLGFKGVW